MILEGYVAHEFIIVFIAIERIFVVISDQSDKL